MHAYKVADATGMLKLDAMENPYTLPADLQEKLGERLGRLAINRYPAGNVQRLANTLAQHLEVAQSSAFELVLGNGSDELIHLLSMVCAHDNATVLAPTPGFVMYSISAQLNHMQYIGIDLTPDFELDVPAMLDAMDAHQPALLYLAYPNNPTANLWDANDIQTLIDKAQTTNTIVAIDEAYQPFSSNSWLDKLRAQPESYPHVVLMRTLSKFGLAGVRLGYMLGHPDLITEIDKARPPYNISVLNAECALFALEHADVFAEQAANICSERTLLQETLVDLGFETFPSQANMLLVRHSNAPYLFDELKERGILIKNMHGSHHLLANCLRITVGTAQENRQLLTTLASLL